MKKIKGVYYKFLFECNNLAGKILKPYPKIAFFKLNHWTQGVQNTKHSESMPRARVTAYVPINATEEYIKPEYDKLSELEEKIKSEVYIADTTSELQRKLCINEIRDAIESCGQLKFFSDERLSTLGDQLKSHFGASDIYIDYKQNVVYKSRDIFYRDKKKSHNPMHSIYEFLMHNILFPMTPFKLIGKSLKDGKPSLVFSQPYIHDVVYATETEIDTYMDLLGFMKEPEQKRWRYNCYRDEYIAIFLTTDNVLSDLQGKLYFVNSLICFLSDPLDVFSHYKEMFQ